jgi:hypothetical protein
MAIASRNSGVSPQTPPSDFYLSIIHTRFFRIAPKRPLTRKRFSKRGEIS